MTEKEIAIKSYKNKKSSECDKLRVEHLKYSPKEIKEQIVSLLNTISENWKISQINLT